MDLYRLLEDGTRIIAHEKNEGLAVRGAKEFNELCDRIDDYGKLEPRLSRCIAVITGEGEVIKQILEI